MVYSGPEQIDVRVRAAFVQARRRMFGAGIGSWRVSLDVNSPPQTWAHFNVTPGVDLLAKAGLIAPFPPPPLMERTSGLTNEQDFAHHGKDIFLALSNASPKPLASYESILDFGIGSARLARMFMGFKGRYVGVDIDHELVAWVAGAMPWVTPAYTRPKEALPYPDATFDLVISVSVFTHMNEADSQFYLRELHRVAKPGATLLLTVHGERVLERAETEKAIFDMLAIERASVEQARSRFPSPGFTFILQDGHLTNDVYQYGISFTSEYYIKSKWSTLFSIERIHRGLIHDFQDVVVLSR